MLRYTLVLVFTFIFIAGGAPAAAVQTGEIAGVVVDATGGVLPGATVTLGVRLRGPRAAQTDAQGRFAFTGLSPGVYAVTVFLSGFGEATRWTTSRSPAAP